MPNLNVLKKISADRSIMEVLKKLASDILTESEAYELICEAFRKDLQTLSAKENLINAATLSDYIYTKLVSIYLLK